jgi:hypothetical protein
MKLLRLWHTLKTLGSWIFGGEPYTDGHLWQDKRIYKDGDKYRVESECIECGKKSSDNWMDEMTYLRTKDQYPPIEE